MSDLPQRDIARNWHEDFPHENGDYFCRCIECQEHFRGHKRRVVCKVCTFKALRSEIERLGKLLAHAREGGEVQDCEACRQWFRLEETISMDEGGWICKGCADPSVSGHSAHKGKTDASA